MPSWYAQYRRAPSRGWDGTERLGPAPSRIVAVAVGGKGVGGGRMLQIEWAYGEQVGWCPRSLARPFLCYLPGKFNNRPNAQAQAAVMLRNW